MKNMKQKLIRFIPVLLACVWVATKSPLSVSAATSWNDLIEQECSGSTADAAERCADNLKTKLKKECGAPKDTQKYKDCRSKFIKGYADTKTPAGSADTSTGCGNVETTYIKCDDRGEGPIVNLLLQLINFLAVGVGIAVVGGITWGGMLYASSNGDSTKAKQGITTIVNAVIGLLVFMFLYALINFLVPGGLFN